METKDLVSSLKVHEISLNEHESSKKSKSIALPSKGKSSKALKVVESEEESPDGDSDEDPTEKMAMLSNKLEYLAKKNRKFLMKKEAWTLADCPDLQKEKSKDKSKRSSFNTRKFRKQIKKSLMATWEDLDSDSDSEKEDSEEDSKVAVGLVATVTSEADSDSDYEDENEICLRPKKDESEECPEAQPTSEAKPTSEAQSENASEDIQDDSQQSVSNEIFKKIMHYESAKETLDALEKLYSGDGKLKKVRLQALRRHYEVLTMEEEEFVSQYFDKVINLTNQMTRNGETVTDVMKWP
ncbi:lisH domain-containing protein C1711.05-like [Medicago truncatula]|uniref:lisH domain-containing protein C1711.05-like n=1 Tax=Medicago truncatula TaxID=3880 RepID=UPI00196834D2|nr:lisH domain-containing protein C1711.05-like [Medicago truncatula]